MRPLNLLNALIKDLAGICLFAVFGLVTAQVIGRFFFNVSFAAASELSIYAMIWSVFLGASVAFRGNQHIAMDVLKALLPPKISKFIGLVIFIGLVVFLSVIAVKGYDLSLRAMRQVSPAAGLPVGYVSMAMPVCSVFALVFLIEDFVLQFKKVPGND